jgi:signal transduction histidine kinase
VRSLPAKLIVAFLCTGLASVALVGLFARYLTVAEFGRFVREQDLVDFTNTAQNYYAQYGTWDGLNQLLRSSPPRTQAANRPGNPPPPPQNGPPPFLLADQSGLAVTGSGGFRPGDRIPAELMDAGTAIEVDGRRVGTVVTTGVTPELSQREREYLNRTNRILLYASVGGALVALLVGWLLTRLLTRPIRLLTEAIRAMQQGQIHQQVPISSRDEIGELVQAFNQLSADLARATTARRQMTADIAHELRTPLSVLTGYIETMRDGFLPPTPERFQTMYAEASQLQRLIDDLRLLSLADAGELRLQRQTVAPRQLLEAAAAAFGPQAAQQRIALHTLAPPDLPDLSLDRERMLQVLRNLVSNALRYTPAGGTITLSAEPAPDAVRLAVADTGSGIPPAALPHIFERLYRADASRTTQDGGTGLGLAIARAFVEAHGGQISAQSTLGQGTRISIELPLSAPLAKPQAGR